MNSRTGYYLVVFLLLFAFTASMINIKYIHQDDLQEDSKKDDKQNELLKTHSRFILPAIAMTCFFVSCVVIAKIVSDGASTGRDKYSGIIFMFVVGLILTLVNIYVLSSQNLTNFIKGKKFTVSGLFMALGVSAIVFGFLDNFGMKLGTEALDNKFLQVFLSPFSKDQRFLQHQESIKENLRRLNDWSNSDWIKIVNHSLRYQDEINKTGKFPDLMNAIRKFQCKPIIIPKEIQGKREVINEYVDNIRNTFSVIDGSKAMLGNTFSDFIGAILGAAIVSLFIYMTSYDGIHTGDDETDNSFFVKNLNLYAPFMEACFIALGCIVPVFLHIALDRKGKDNSACWIIVGIIGVLMLTMMAISSYGVRDMTTSDKKRSIRKTFNDMMERIDLSDKTSLPLEERAIYGKLKSAIESI